MPHTIAPLKGLVAATFTPLREDRSLHLEAIAPMVDRLLRLLGMLTCHMVLTNCGASAELSVERVTLFEEGRDGFTLYRIPGIVVTSGGSVLAYCEARKFSTADRGEIEIHLRRSTDGGRTWSPPQQVAHLGERLPRNPHLPLGKQAKDFGGPEEQTVNNPVAIACRNGTVHLLYCVEYMRCFHIRSDDDGVSWSRPVEITKAFEAFRSGLDWQAMATGPGHAIELRNGRLVVPFWMSNYDPSVKQGKGVGVVFSDDNGISWQSGEIALRDAGEPNIIELPDGGVLLTARNGNARSRRISTTSINGATGWSTPRFIWERSTRVPYIIVAPNVTPTNTLCSRPVGLIDTFPALNELCSLPTVEGLDGVSLAPLLKEPSLEWSRPALTTHGQSNHSLRTDRWRYIRYANGDEELYDHTTDPHEWYNLAARPEFSTVKTELAGSLPQFDASALRSKKKPKERE